MTNFIAKAIVAATIALGAFATISAPVVANAAQVEVIVKKKPVVVVRKKVVVVKPVVRKPVIVVKPVVVRKPVVVIKPVVVRPVVVKPVVVVPAGRCPQGLALQKATNAGLNRVAVSFIGPNRVTVSGKRGGAWLKMNFANVAGCPRL